MPIARLSPPTPIRSWRSAQRRTADEAQGTTDLFGGGRQAGRLVLRVSRRLDADGSASRPSSRRSAFIFRATRSTNTSAYWQSLASNGCSEFEALGAAWRDRRTSWPESSLRRANGARRKATSLHSRCSRTRRGQFEAVIFSDTLAASRELLEPGTPVIVSVEAERDGETMKMRVQSLEALDKAAASVPRNLKLVLDRKSIVANAIRCFRSWQISEACRSRRRSADSSCRSKIAIAKWNLFFPADMKFLRKRPGVSLHCDCGRNHRNLKPPVAGGNATLRSTNICRHQRRLFIHISVRGSDVRDAS